MSNPNSSSEGNLLLRNDTFLGVCEGLGQDFGIHPNFLRIALAIGFFFSPAIVVGLYLALGVLVAAARFVVPDRKVQSPPMIEAVAGEQDPGQDKDELPLAA